MSISEKWDHEVLWNTSMDHGLDWGHSKVISHHRTNFIAFSHSVFRDSMFIILKLSTKVNSFFSFVIRFI